MDDIVNELVQTIRETPKVKVSRTCPICSGGYLLKPKVTQNLDEDISVQVSTDIGELCVTVADGDNIVNETIFPIKYCPCCGRKVKEKYRKTKK